MRCSICGRAFPVDDETIVMLDEDEGDDAMYFCIVGNGFKPDERIACGRCAVEACRALHALVQRARVVGAQQRGNCDDHEHSIPDEAHECTAGAMVSSDDESFNVLVDLCSSAAMLADD